MAFKLSHEFVMFVGTVVLALFIVFDVCKAYIRGAKWLSGNFLLFCGLCVQLLGYLDTQQLSFACRHNDCDLEGVIDGQLSIDLSRLVLFVFVGYLLPGLASAARIWSNIAALLISLSSHIAVELLAIQTYGKEKDKVVKGQSGIWLIAYHYVLLSSILGLLFLLIWAIGSGRFIRDNLSSRILSVLPGSDNNLILRIPSLLSGNDNNEVSTWSWEAYESEILKSWIITCVCQPEYVLGRTMFSAGVGTVLTNCVGVFIAKVLCLRSQLHGSLPLLTLQFVFIILVWFAVMYRCFSWWLSGLILGNKFVEGLCRVQRKPRCEQDFIDYEPTLKRLCGPGEDPNSLWLANESSFKKIQDKVREAYRNGGKCQELITVIRNKPGGDYVERVGQLLEPLESVKEYFPLLKNSFRRITALCLLFIMHELMRDQNKIAAYEQASELMDFIDCPDDMGINVDVLRTKNVEAFELKSGSRGFNYFEFVPGQKKMEFRDLRRKSKVKELNTAEDALSYISELQKVAKAKLEGFNLLGEELNVEVLITDWSVAADFYGLYKVCKTILDWSVEPDSHFLDTVHMADELSHLFAELMACYVEESLEILLSSTKKWAKKFKEDKITAAIHIAGFAWGVKDGAQKSDDHIASTTAADTTFVIPEPDNL
ncbi:hypothetical protein SUGI_0094310 [Cryptomeria japonica]|nr:hypothetical protein SUGI_0094310 [Cryptomeria japonica]